MKALNRRNFIATAGAGLAAGAILPGRALPVAGIFHTPKAVKTLELGLASYTTREFSLDDTIKMTQRLGLKHLGLKSFHLPLTSTEAECNAAAAKIRDAGIDFYTAGVIYMKTKDEVDQAYQYARACGIRYITGSPSNEMLPLCNEYAKKFNIGLAIHNHGPGDDLNPTVPSIYEKVKNLDSRIGICMDIGHVVRLNRDPVAEFKQCFDRIIDLHIKDVNEASAKGDTIEMGRGVINLPAFFRTVLAMNYKGMASFEYEKDAKDPLPGLAESVGYVHGVLATLNS